MFATEKLVHLTKEVEQQCSERLKEVDDIIDYNQWRIIDQFQKHRVSDFHFSGSTGYGYNDAGREVLDDIYAEVFGAESGLVRPHFASGTHTISAALFGVLRPGDELLYITGTPYDTLHKVIGKDQDDPGTLRNWGIVYNEVALTDEGKVDWEAVRSAWSERVKVVGIQRSRGYSWRPSYLIEEISEMIRFVKKLNPNVIVFVDNCYGEFTEKLEPSHVGANLVAGSLIKNPGGGIALSGGYIVGDEAYVQLAADRLTAPGLGFEVGATLDTMRSLYQGFYFAPHIVGQAVKGSVFASALFEKLGWVTSPNWHEKRTDIIQAIQFDNEQQLIAFVQGIQTGAAIDAHVTPVPAEMPGYEHEVIMAAGTFIQGGSLEQSADAPIREPYTAYLQGGLTYSHAKYGVVKALNHLIKLGLLSDDML